MKHKYFNQLFQPLIKAKKTMGKKCSHKFHHAPSNQQKLSHQALSSHGHQYASHRHALAEAGHHPGLGQVASQLLQQFIKALFPGVAVYLIGVGDTDTLFCCHVFKCLHTTLTIITYGGEDMNGMVIIYTQYSTHKTWALLPNQS